MKIISIHQPSYIPWLGFFEKIKASDVFVLLDNVQFSKGSYINRNKIELNGKSKWLTVPIKTSGKYKINPIKDLEISGNSWGKTHINLINESYHESKYFKDYYTELEKFYKSNWKLFLPLSAEMLTFFLGILNIKTKIILSSKLNLGRKKSDLVLDLCKDLKADIYYSGQGGKDYLNLKSFEKNNILVKYQEYIPDNNFSIVHNLFKFGNKIL